MMLLVVGSVALDSIRTPLGAVENALGGSATYASLAASVYTTPRLVAVVGRDFPPRHRRLLARKGVDLAGFVQAPGRTFRWQGRYGYDLNIAETLGVQLNVFQHFAPELPPGWSDTPYAFLGNIDPELQLRVRRQLTRPRLVACDSMNFWIAGKRRALMNVLKVVDLLFLNDAEARQLTGESHLGRVAQALIRCGPSLVVIKKGEHGALLASRGRYFTLPGFVVDDVRDPTGAGDSFAGGMLGYLAWQRRLTWDTVKQAMIRGSAVATLTIEAFGTDRLAAVRRPVVERRVAAYRRLTNW
ncbi:MAG: sugar kinase [Omnitrophica WOR_2 bacterium RIFCSPHIGHO2_02_FULL_68_15]|nr:MAG: sugar kinase [Omnitrophica WOR_2 bacterium RIFCSPHIGHO2_02_FULL_68_15]